MFRNSATFSNPQLYSIRFFNDQIRATLTKAASVVDEWISEIQRIHHGIIDGKKPVVGLDVEWRPSFSRGVSNKAAVLQLCVERTCLIFQLHYADQIPNSLVNFLKDPSLSFVGVGIVGDVEKLSADHGLKVLKTMDLRFLAANKLSKPELRGSGLKGLTKEVLGKEVTKPRKVTMSKWDAEQLSYNQVQYACLDAFLSFQIGKVLLQESKNSIRRTDLN